MTLVAQVGWPRPVGLHQCEGTISIGNIRCSRSGTVEHEGGWYCRKHVPAYPVIEAEIDESMVTLCACGCGEPVNPWLAVFRTAVADGFTHKEIGDSFGFDRSYVGSLLRKPPTTIPGHSGRIYWASDEGRDRRAQWLVALQHEADRRAETLRDRRARKARREFDARERAARIEAARGEGLLVKWMLPLDKLYTTGDYAPHTAHDFFDLDAGGDPLDAVLDSERASDLARIVGTLDPDEIDRMDGETLDWIREKLRAEGLVPHGVQKDERERLRNPQAHSGAAIMKAKGGGGKRTRLQQQQVTIDHHVRDLPQAEKQRQAQVRSRRRRRVAS